MSPKKPTLSKPSRPASGTLELAATGSAVPLKVPSPPPDRPVAGAAAGHSGGGGLKTRVRGADPVPLVGIPRRTGSRTRRVHGGAGMVGGAPSTTLPQGGRESALRPGVAAALASRTNTQVLWSTGAPSVSEPSTRSQDGPAAATSASKVGTSVGSAARVGRLLRDARATVRAPVRPETPMEYLQPGPVRHRSSAAVVGGHPASPTPPRPPPGRRLAALKPLDTTTMTASGAQTPSSSLAGEVNAAVLSPSSAAVAAVVRNSQVVADEYLAQLIQAEGNETVQTALLRELARWLSNPTNRVWPELLAYFADFLCTAVEYPSADRRADTTVGVLMGGIVLRNCTDVLSCPVLAPLTRLLRTQVQSAGQTDSIMHLSTLLERESLFEPLSYILRQCCGAGGAGGATAASDAAVASSLEMYTSVALDVLEVLRGCTTTYHPEHHPRTRAPQGDASGSSSPSAVSGGRRRSDTLPAVSTASAGGGVSSTAADGDWEDEQTIWRQQEAQTDRVCELLVTNGLLPTLNALLRSLLQHHRCAPEEDMASGMLLPSACLLLRNLARSERHSALLHRLGTLELLVQVLECYADEVYIMEAVSRALAKLVFVPECLLFCQQETRLVEAAVAVLLRHTEPISEQAMLSGNGAGTLSTHVKVLVARLCSTVARVAEGSSAQRDALARSCADALLPRLVDYFVTRETVDVILEWQHEEGLAGSAGGAETTSAHISRDVSTVSAGGCVRRRRGSLLDAQFSEDSTDTSLLEGVVWLVGLVAMSAACTTSFVRATAPALTDLLKTLDFGPTTRLTCVYTLMALSNLSYFFASIEREDAIAASEDDPDAEHREQASVGDDDDSASGRSSLFLSQLYEVLGLCLAGFLFEGDVEATVESTRVLGNMSFTNTGRDWMETNHCDEVMTIFLGHEDLRVVYNCFGVVLNLTAGTQCRLVQEPELLRMLLQSTGRYTRREDIDLAAKEEKRHLLEAALASASGDDEGDVSADRRRRRPLLTEREAARLAELEAQELATGYATQIADLVEKVLENVHGLILGSRAAADDEPATLAS